MCSKKLPSVLLGHFRLNKNFKVKCFDEQSYLFLNEYLSETHSELVSFDQLPQNFNRRLYNKLITINKNLSLSSSKFVKNIKNLFCEMENIKKHCADIQLSLNQEIFTNIQKYCDKICLNYVNHKPDSVLTIQEMVSMNWYLKSIEDIGTFRELAPKRKRIDNPIISNQIKNLRAESSMFEACLICNEEFFSEQSYFTPILETLLKGVMKKVYDIVFHKLQVNQLVMKVMGPTRYLCG
ncbi:hypothetical protein BLOT_003761 [Blomia tropicalis]|nr:hypothetical protein BLOT_003761 [Blomia tropicalis]